MNAPSDKTLLAEALTWTPPAGAAVEPAPPIGPRRGGEFDGDAALAMPADPLAETAAPAMPEMEPVQLTHPVPSGRKGSAAVTRLLAIGAFVLVGGLAFAVGRMTTTTSGSSGLVNGGGPNGLPGDIRPNGSGAPGGAPGGFDPAGRGGLTIEGTVETVGSGSITVKLANGQTVTVATSSTTTYHGQAAASQADVTSGKTVTIAVAPASGTGTAGGTTATRTASDVTIASD